MLKSKRFNVSMAAVVVLAVVLAMAITAGATLAWFASQSAADITLQTGDPVVIRFSDEDDTDIVKDAGGKMDIQIPANFLVPGMSLYPNVFVSVDASTTSALLRAYVEIEATGADIDAEDLEEIETHLLEQFAKKSNGWYYDDPAETGDGYFYFVGNGASYSMYMTKVADLTELDSVVASKYATAGDLLTTDNDYSPFTNQTVGYDPGTGALTAADTNQALLSNLGKDGITEGNEATTLIASVVTLAEDETNTAYSTFSGTTALVPFLVRPVIIPIGWTNDIANASITITITFEAVQDYLVNPNAVDQDAVSQVLPTLANAKAVFNSAFPTSPGL